jgi:hypothetical protein
MYGNRRLARAQAAFVGLLYVFLTTFGTLTHTHAWIGGEIEDAVAVVAPRSQSASEASGIAAFRHRPDTPSHCAFCDWQANGVSVALPIHHCVLPRLVALAPPRLVAISISIQSVETSSRAPPVA